MFSVPELKGWMQSTASFAEKQLTPWLPSIAELLNAYGSVMNPSGNDVDVQFTLQRVGQALKDNPQLTAEGVKVAVIQGLISMGVKTPPTVNSFVMPPPANDSPKSEVDEFQNLKSSQTLHKYHEEKEPSPLARLRTEKTRNHGRRLAEQAIALKGKLKWIPRGQEGYLPVQTTGFSTSGQGINQFWQWISGGVKPSDFQVATMNCWESVLYCAWKAELLGKGVLRGIYEDAVLKARLEFTEANFQSVNRTGTVNTAAMPKMQDAHAAYLSRLFKFLGGDKAVEINAYHDDPPQPGDIIFIGRMNHVCIAIGCLDSQEPSVMSLWEHDNGLMTRLTVEDLADEQGKDFLVCPCPF